MLVPRDDLRTALGVKYAAYIALDALQGSGRTGQSGVLDDEAEHLTRSGHLLRLALREQRVVGARTVGREVAQKVRESDPLARHVGKLQRVLLAQCGQLGHPVGIAARGTDGLDQTRHVAVAGRCLDHKTAHQMLVELERIAVRAVVGSYLLGRDVGVDLVVDIVLVELAHDKRLAVAFDQTVDILLRRGEQLGCLTHLQAAHDPVVDIQTGECQAVARRESRRHVGEHAAQRQLLRIDARYDVRGTVDVRFAPARAQCDDADKTQYGGSFAHNNLTKIRFLLQTNVSARNNIIARAHFCGSYGHCAACARCRTRPPPSRPARGHRG